MTGMICLKEDKNIFLWILLLLMQKKSGKRNQNCSDPETAKTTWCFNQVRKWALLRHMGLLLFGFSLLLFFPCEVAKYSFLRELQDKGKGGEPQRTLRNTISQEEIVPKQQPKQINGTGPAHLEIRWCFGCLSQNRWSNYGTKILKWRLQIEN